MNGRDIKVSLYIPAPFEVGEEEAWRKFENSVGLRLPEDYKYFVQAYGTGCVDSFLWIFNPFSHNEYLNLEKQIAESLETLRMLDEKPPFPLFPEPGGLLPFGATDNGDTLYWLTSGGENRWAIAVHESRGPQWETYDISFTDFLTKILSREIICPIFPDDFPSVSPSFESRAH